MKRGFESNVCGLEQIVLFTVLIVAGPLPTVGSVWGEDESISATPGTVAKATPSNHPVESDDRYQVDQIHAEVRLYSVPTELVESTILDWTIAPFDLSQLAAADPFVVMNQPLERQTGHSGDKPHAHMAAGTNMQIPTTHKILDDHEVQQLLGQLVEDERTEAVFCPRLACLDGTTATAVVGQKTPFIVGWNDGLPQTRVVSEGTMARLRTVLDDQTIWLDYEIVMSRILDVTSRSIRVVNRTSPVVIAVPNVQTTTATSTVELPVGGTVLIGGLPAESKNDVPSQLLVFLRVGRMREVQAKPTANSKPQAEPRDADLASPASPTPPTEPTASPRAVRPKKRNPFSLISRILNRAPRQGDAAPLESLPLEAINRQEE